MNQMGCIIHAQRHVCRGDFSPTPLDENLKFCEVSAAIQLCKCNLRVLLEVSALKLARGHMMDICMIVRDTCGGVAQTMALWWRGARACNMKVRLSTYCGWA